VLVTVKGYPQPVKALDEMVCTAGFREDGSWIRIYPIPFSYLYEDGFPKYSWVELDLKKETSDARPESYVPADLKLRDLKIVSQLDTKDKWRARRRICLNNVYDSIEELIVAAKDRSRKVSLATYKPARIIEPVVENASSTWDPKWLAKAEELDLFHDPKKRKKPRIEKVPFKFSYSFQDENGKERKLRIIDWEIGALYWKCLANADGRPDVAASKVKDKLTALIETDLHFFLGTTKSNHFRAPNPFIIIGLFYPPKPSPTPLFG